MPRFLRAIAYFVEEALTSLWRSRLVHALSIMTIAVSLFVLGAFLTLAANLNQMVSQWAEKIQVTFYLEDGRDPAERDRLFAELHAHPAVEHVELVTREEALSRFRALYRDLRSLPEDLGENPFPASIEVTLKAAQSAPADAERLVAAFGRAPGVEEVQYDRLWIQRLTTAVRLVRGVGAFLGGILVLAGIFTIANAIRLTVYARQDELDIMRLVGATRAYVRGPFIVEGVIQGGLGGLVAAGLLWVLLRYFGAQAVAASDLLARTTFTLPTQIVWGLVGGGMLVGWLGSWMSLGRSQV